ncbi:MAG: hypothetical protein IKN54_01855 [Lachnospiraceae bacterium]|nr:hypothetical protein [Lachnospiraceae bacterium]
MKKRLNTVDIKNLITASLLVITVAMVVLCVKSFDIAKKRAELTHEDQKVMVEISTEDESATGDGESESSTKEKVTVNAGD